MKPIHTILTKTRLGPKHHGRKMSLKAFEFAPVQEGYDFELARGYVVVSEVPNPPHARTVALIRTHLGHYQIELPQPCMTFMAAWNVSS